MQGIEGGTAEEGEEGMNVSGNRVRIKHKCERDDENDECYLRSEERYRREREIKWLSYSPLPFVLSSCMLPA